jgi:CubicO group peptidase (beta-lactamase class C family)
MKRFTSLVFTTAFFTLAISQVPALESAFRFPRSSPEAQGIASADLLAFIEAADTQIDAMHSFMLVRHGHVVAEGWWTPYGADIPHTLYSLSKSFTSTAVGLAVAEGKLSLDDSVLAAFPDDAPAEPSDPLKSMRVRDLLRMSTGQHTEPKFGTGTNWVRTFLAEPVAHKPGTFFLYNTPATFMLSAMVQKATGMTVLDYLRPRLFEPLGIENPTWGTSPEGITLGGYGLSIRTEDIARFGQLYLQKGRWNGRQIVPAEYVEAATSRQTANGSNPKSDWDQGYGFQFWRCRHNAYRGDGAFGQYCIVMPDQDAVVAITSGVRDMQAVMNLVWDRLLPALRAAALPSNEVDQRKLEGKLAGLSLRPQTGAAKSPRATQVTGKRYQFPADDTAMIDVIGLDTDASGNVTLVLQKQGAEQRVACGQAGWEKGRLALGPQPEQPVAASGAWITEGTYAVKLCLYETPHALNLQLKFAGDEVTMDAEFNVAFGPTKQPQKTGHVK